jgi:uncharacterized protein (TIGR03086 family)
MEPVAALERAYESMSKAAANVSADQLTATSQCSDWDVKAMLNHAFGAGWMFTKAQDGGGSADREDAGDVVGDDPAGACAKLATANIAAWKGEAALEGDRTYPFGTFPAPAALMLNIGEVAVHAWDLAKSTGQEASIDPEVGQLLWDFYTGIDLDMYRQYGAFGQIVPVPESAPIGDRVLGHIGFQP